MRMIRSGITVAMVLVMGPVTSMAQSSGQHAQGRRIEGTWVVDLRFADCQTGVEAANATSPALHTFLAGGSMLSDPAVSPVALGTGHGVWEHTEGENFTNTLVLFRFNPNGSYAGPVTVRREIELSQDAAELFSRDTAVTSDLNGNVLETRCAVGRGRRLE
jgi:hypothetical protein